MSIKIVTNVETSNMERVTGFYLTDELKKMNLIQTHESFEIINFIKPTYRNGYTLYFEYEPNKYVEIKQPIKNRKRKCITLPKFVTRYGREITIKFEWLFSNPVLNLIYNRQIFEDFEF